MQLKKKRNSNHAAKEKSLKNKWNYTSPNSLILEGKSAGKLVSLKKHILSPENVQNIFANPKNIIL